MNQKTFDAHATKYKLYFYCGAVNNSCK